MGTKQIERMRGFTLIETAVCLLILLTLFFLVIPQVERGMERRAMEELVAMYTADYLYAQSLAVAQGVETSIQFAPGDYFYAIKLGRTTVKKVPYHRHIQVSSNYGMPFPHAVRFDARGYVHKGGTITLSGKHWTKRLIIQLMTGRIRVEDG